MRPRYLIMFALGAGAFSFPYLYAAVGGPQPSSGGGGYLDVVPHPVYLVIFAVYGLGALVSIAFFARSLIGVGRRESWSVPFLGLALVPFVPLLMASLVGWQTSRPRQAAVQRVESAAESFLAELEVGGFTAACRRTAPSFPVDAGGFPDCPSALVALRQTYPGELSVDKVHIGWVVVAHDGRPAFELTIVHDRQTKQTTITGTDTVHGS